MKPQPAADAASAAALSGMSNSSSAGGKRTTVLLVLVTAVTAFAAGQFAEHYGSSSRWQLLLPRRHTKDVQGGQPQPHSVDVSDKPPGSDDGSCWSKISCSDAAAAGPVGETAQLELAAEPADLQPAQHYAAAAPRPVQAEPEPQQQADPPEAGSSEHQSDDVPSAVTAPQQPQRKRKARGAGAKAQQRHPAERRPPLDVVGERLRLIGIAAIEISTY